MKFYLLFFKRILQALVLVPTYHNVIIHSAPAYDPDEDSDLVYEIVSGNSQSRFGVDSETGDIYVVDPVDLDDSYDLVVKVGFLDVCKYILLKILSIFFFAV